MTENEKRIGYMCIYNWMHKKSITNFIALYNTFLFPYKWQGCCYRVWRIFFNTISGKYAKLLEDCEKYFDETLIK